MFTMPSRKLLACCLLGLACPALGLEPAAPSNAASDYHAHQRALLEAYVECVRSRSLPATAAAPTVGIPSCAQQRAAYAGSLPPDLGGSVLDAIEAGPKAPKVR